MLRIPPSETGDWNEATVLQYDAWSRITEVRRASDDTVLAKYGYDGLGRRTKREIDGVVHHTYYSDTWRPVEERKDDETTPSAQYLWGARHRDDLVRRDRATSGTTLNETRYVLMDYYSPAAITDETGTVTERYAFSAFGVRQILAPDFSPRSTSECGFEFAFQGQFEDVETGYLNYGYRYYVPWLGRWTCKDPIGISGGLNLYGMVRNGAVNWVDFLGLMRCCFPTGKKRNAKVESIYTSFNGMKADDFENMGNRVKSKDDGFLPPFTILPYTPRQAVSFGGKRATNLAVDKFIPEMKKQSDQLNDIMSNLGGLTWWVEVSYEICKRGGWNDLTFPVWQKSDTNFKYDCGKIDLGELFSCMDKAEAAALK
jgi:RHS repeat-associated protein